MRLKDTITGKKAIYKTTFKYKVKGDILYASFSAYHSSLTSHSNKNNDYQFNGDVVEIFITRDTINHYYEFEFAPNNTILFGDVHANGKTHTIDLLDNIAVSSETKIKGQNFFVKIQIDLKKLNIDKTTAKFNAFRLETDGETPEKHKFALNPTYQDYFHIPDAFIPLL